jgi:predicted nucleic acid-binding protein
LRKTREAVVSDLVEVEFFSALARRVRMGDLQRRDAQRISALFISHLEDQVYARLSMERDVYLTARALLGTFELPLRTLDALHLAAAANHGVPIATLDRALARAADGLGIRVRRIGRQSTGSAPAT